MENKFTYVDQSKTFKKRLLIDTNLMLLLLVGDFDQELIEKFKRTRTFLKEDYIILKIYIEEFSEIVTTPHIMTEVCNLADSLCEPKRNEFFAFLTETIPIYFEESEPTKNIVIGDPFAKFGLTDSVIHYLSQNDKNIQVATIDGPLYGYLVNNKIKCVNFNTLREYLLLE